VDVATLDREVVAVGQRVEVSAQTFTSTADAIEAKQHGSSADQFFVYLLRGLNYSVVHRAMGKAEPRHWWSLGDAAAFRVARVRFGDTGSNLENVSASFIVPALPLGTYRVMFCDAGCTRPLANVIPARGFTIVADRSPPAFLCGPNRLELQPRRQIRRLDETRAAAWSAQAAASIARTDVTKLPAQLQAANRRIAPARGSGWQHVPWLLAGVMFGALLAFASRRGRPPGREPAELPVW
jgi:hypothetical protein